MLCNFVFGFFFLWKSIAVNGQTLVSASVIKEGGTFTVTCDASRAGVPTTATTVVSLVIGWTAGTAVPTTFARYRLFPSPYNSNSPPQTSPARNWTFNFTGSQREISATPNNRNTMKIEMVVYDARCTDAGLYFCNATYLNTVGEATPTAQYQTVTGITRVVPMSLTLDPQYSEGLGPYQSVNPAGSNVALTCRVYGPKALTFTWKYGPSRSDVNSFTSYPVQNAISVDEPVQISSGTTCVQYGHTSTLKFQTEDMYDGYMYVCVATENNEDTIVGNIIIYTQQVTAPPSTESENNKNGVNVLYSVLPIVAVVVVGAVVGVVVVNLRKGCPNRVTKKASEPKPTTTTTRRTLPTPPDSDGYLQAIDVRETARHNALPDATYPTPVIDQIAPNYYSSIDDPHYSIQRVAGDQNYQNTTTGRHNRTMNVNNAPQNSASNVNKDSENYLIPLASNVNIDSQNYLIPSASNVNKDSQNYLIPLASNVNKDSQNYFLPKNEFNTDLDIYDTLDDLASGHQYSNA
ncbi:uncharacterized protein LOC131944733 [Physella acuta]|uniref:uncharacterized protein LOC131944733 n=1 Tax=Physella acuta TaxID=109671 RepID=UPI0027DB08FF|nr:uncharacterized protein LOC131944733 [Physella acuta]